MNAQLDPIDFDRSVFESEPETDLLTVRLDVALIRKLEVVADRIGLLIDDHVAGYLEEAIFINSRGFFHPDNTRAHRYRLMREARRSKALGPDLALMQAKREIAEAFGAKRSSDLFSGLSNPTSPPPGMSSPDTGGSSSTGSC